MFTETASQKLQNLTQGKIQPRHLFDMTESQKIEGSCQSQVNTERESQLERNQAEISKMSD